MPPISAYRPSNVPEYYLKNTPGAENVINSMPFSFSTTFTANLAANVTVQQIIETLSDSDFVCISLQSDNVSVLPSVLVRDTSTNWPLMNSAVPVVSIFGTAALPYFLPIPWKWQRKTSIQVNVTPSALLNVTFTLTFSGIRIFKS